MLERIAAMIVAVSLPAVVAAADYPTRPIRIVIPLSAGSATDMLARMIGPKLVEVWGQPVVVDHRPSAGGTIAGGIVAAKRSSSSRRRSMLRTCRIAVPPKR